MPRLRPVPATLAVLLAVLVAGCADAPVDAPQPAAGPRPEDPLTAGPDVFLADLHAVRHGTPGLSWHGDWGGGVPGFRDRLPGMTVVGPTGDAIGEVEAVLANPDGMVVALVVETGGFLDVLDTDATVPLTNLSPANGGDALVTMLTQEELDSLPEWED